MPSKQYEWQQKMVAAGRCCICGRRAVTKHHCEIHAEDVRKRSRDRYRRAHGIPLDAPIGKRGRPRISKSSSEKLPANPAPAA